MWECVWIFFEVTPFVILNIFISNCNLITYVFLVTVTNYNYFILYLNYVILLHVTSYSPALFIKHLYQTCQAYLC